MQIKNKKRGIKTIIVSILSLAIIFLTIYITKDITRDEASLESETDVVRSYISNALSYLDNENTSETLTIYLYCLSGMRRCDIDISSFKNRDEFVANIGGFPSSSGNEFLEKCDEFYDNYPDLTHVYEAYENNEIDLATAKEMYLIEIKKVLEECGFEIREDGWFIY